VAVPGPGLLCEKAKHKSSRTDRDVFAKPMLHASNIRHNSRNAK